MITVDGIDVTMKNIDQLSEKIKELSSLRAEMITALQQRCGHSGIIYHADFKPGTFFAASWARRMCACCRLEEESSSAWDTFKVLNCDDLRKVVLDRDQFYKQRI